MKKVLQKSQTWQLNSRKWNRKSIKSRKKWRKKLVATQKQKEGKREESKRFQCVHRNLIEKFRCSFIGKNVKLHFRLMDRVTMRKRRFWWLCYLVDVEGFLMINKTIFPVRMSENDTVINIYKKCTGHNWSVTINTVVKAYKGWK